MLPVRVKVLSSSSLTLSQASSLLQRFLSGDACSDSLARDYVANVAQALQDSISRRAGESGGTHTKHRHFPDSQKRRKKEKIDRGGEHITAESVTPDSKKHHEKKKRKDKQEAERNSIERASPVLDDKNFHEKKKRKREKQDKYAENLETLHVKEFGIPPTSISVGESLHTKSAAKGKKKQDVGILDADMSVSDTLLLIVNDAAGSLKREKKKEQAGVLATPDKLTFKKITEKTDVEALCAESRSFDAEEKKRKRKRRRKEEPKSE